MARRKRGSSKGLSKADVKIINKQFRKDVENEALEGGVGSKFDIGRAIVTLKRIFKQRGSDFTNEVLARGIRAEIKKKKKK